MAKINYFAYGSNMSEPRLKARVSSATKVGMATLKEYQLRFNKIIDIHDAKILCSQF